MPKKEVRGRRARGELELSRPTSTPDAKEGTRPSGQHDRDSITMTTMTTISQLTAQLSASLRRPTARTLRLLDRALAWLQPFESASARTASPAERADLLALLSTHRLILSPYADLDRIESNLRRPI